MASCVRVILHSSSTWLRASGTSLHLFPLIGNCYLTKAVRFSLVNKMYHKIERGTLYTPDYRIFFKNDRGPISPFHDIPLYPTASRKVCNMIVEIPRWTNAKMEEEPEIRISTKEPLNPIKQDVKKGKVRFVANCFPHHGYIWNYGAFPQTWENPSHLDAATGCKGDDDPIDVIEIGSRVAERGEVFPVKILGCIALIDEGETDWKIIAIDNRDALAKNVNDIADVENYFPGLLKATVEWFRIYKIPEGKPENTFAFNGEPKSRDFAVSVVEEVHNLWKSMMQNESDKNELACQNLTVMGNNYQITLAKANEIVNEVPPPGPAAKPDPSVFDKWHFIQLNRA